MLELRLAVEKISQYRVLFCGQPELLCFSRLWSVFCLAFCWRRRCSATPCSMKRSFFTSSGMSLMISGRKSSIFGLLSRGYLKEGTSSLLLISWASLLMFASFFFCQFSIRSYTFCLGQPGLPVAQAPVERLGGERAAVAELDLFLYVIRHSELLDFLLRFIRELEEPRDSFGRLVAALLDFGALLVNVWREGAALQLEFFGGESALLLDAGQPAEGGLFLG